MVSTPPIQWYPGHIAKAERALLDQLKRVDLVFEVRDARIPLASRHPKVLHWIGEKPRILVLNRMDLISAAARDHWREYFKAIGETPFFTNAQAGKGLQNVMQASQAAGKQLNQRRRDRGMLPRPVRAVVIGFPNVGKSALINRLLKRRIVESARRPGVTRQLRWVRVSQELELLDAPGVLPAKLTDQSAAYRLAMCDDIGQAAYDNQRVCAQLIEQLQQIEAYNEVVTHYVPCHVLASRYDLALTDQSGDEYLAELAQLNHRGDVERTAQQVLNDFRKGMLGAIALETPPENSTI
ncbi:ribosome biogenesis GTPase YlqF [Lyngbya confervoides]|uniref:Ribosome biogenesis GTPase A n=1 Tax=Lyngbya confervoides BDU141951 TaxID=1574623 RepID=A0ABD4T4Q4_9CYAN|nr:ribosome biogenesis GTPase YlqF [Lyngbya confervoides]MCM1983335.1 ribosome biogenesis GTPase YlqF [Lyngbya confervoides BDU141951]